MLDSAPELRVFSSADSISPAYLGAAIPTRQGSFGSPPVLKNAYISCGSCGHQFPLEFVRQRTHFVCNCGMRLTGTMDVADMVRTAFLLLMFLVLLTGLLIAGYVLARKLGG